jgi:hypothetical protein
MKHRRASEGWIGSVIPTDLDLLELRELLWEYCGVWLGSILLHGCGTLDGFGLSSSMFRYTVILNAHIRSRLDKYIIKNCIQ